MALLPTYTSSLKQYGDIIRTFEPRLSILISFLPLDYSSSKMEIIHCLSEGNLSPVHALNTHLD